MTVGLHRTAGALGAYESLANAWPERAWRGRIDPTETRTYMENTCMPTLKGDAQKGIGQLMCYPDTST